MSPWLSRFAPMPARSTAGLLLALVAAACTAPTSDGPGGGSGDDDDDTVPDPLPPTLVSATAKQAGQFGDHVRFDVVGRDPEANAPYLRVALLDVDGAPVLRYDSDGDAQADSNETTLPMQVPVLGATDTAGILYIPDLQRFTFEAVRFELALVDHQGLASDPLEVDLDVQDVLAQDAPCDPTYVDDRCQDGLSCRGEPAPACTPGDAPAIGRAAYLNDALGPRVLVEGVDPDDDVDALRVDFLNDEGLGVAVDLDNDGTPDASHFVFDELRITREGSFFYRFDPSENFTTLVSRLAFQTTDRGGRTSERVERDLGPAPVKNIGADCDPRGFDVCRNAVCNPGVVGVRNTCQSTSVAQRSACSDAPEVVPTVGPVSIRGTVSQPSRWDAPEGCLTGDPTMRADAVVKVVLERDVARLRISTGDPYSSFDSVLYLLTGCSDDPVGAWCRDDDYDAPRSWLARLTVENLPAGTYYLVVDSFQPIESGDFQLDMIAE